MVSFMTGKAGHRDNERASEILGSSGNTCEFRLQISCQNRFYFIEGVCRSLIH